MQGRTYPAHPVVEDTKPPLGGWELAIQGNAKINTAR
jgi:hypothetical protein